MINVILSGMGFGLVLAFLLGPVFFGLLQTSISKGFRYGVYFAIGVAISDVVFILLTYFGISSFVENQTFRQVVGIVGGSIMCLFGVYYFLKKQEKAVPVTDIKASGRKANVLLKGFVLNLFNPSVLFFWIGVVTVISVRYEDSHLEIFMFFTAAILTVLGMDITKSYVANRIKGYFTTKTLNLVNKVLGVIFFIVGVKIFIDTITGHLDISTI